jgi:energy-coupling factor transport system permease protein
MNLPGRSAATQSDLGGGRRLPRALHPLAWWAWALGLAVAVTATTNPLLLLEVVAVLGFVVANRRSDAPWARAFKYYLYLALTVVAIRVVFLSLFGGTSAEHAHVLFTVPHLPIPGGVRLGGPVSVEGVAGAVTAGLRLGVLLCCLGAANSLANPKRALRALPGALYELGVAVVVTFTVAPQLVESVQRVHRARRLRGAAGSRAHVLRGVVIPVLEDALDRSLRLAAAMDSRGYGRSTGATPAARRLTGALLVGGLCGLCYGTYGLLDRSAVGPSGVPALLAGGGLCVAGLIVGGRRVRRTAYRPDPWLLPEWGVVACGLVPVVVTLAALGTSATGLHPSLDPLAWPALPPGPAVAVAVAGLAGVIAPPPVRRPARAPDRTPDRITDGAERDGRPAADALEPSGEVAA